MKGITTRDIEFRGPSTLASGTIKAGTPVHYVKKGDWAAWVVTRNEDAPFFCEHDWRHRYVDVPSDAVQIEKLRTTPAAPQCPYCKGKSVPVSGEYVYPHRPDLFEKKFFMCVPCEAYVGVHAATGEPLGTLANAYLRKLRSQAHAAFDPVWKDAASQESLAEIRDGRRKKFTPYGQLVTKHRTAAYARLAELMDISVENCHIGSFDAAQCRRVIDLCNSREIHRSR